MKISKKRKSLLEKIMFSILLSVFAVFVFTVTGCDSGMGFENYSVDECYVTKNEPEYKEGDKNINIKIML